METKEPERSSMTIVSSNPVGAVKDPASNNKPKPRTRGLAWEPIFE